MKNIRRNFVDWGKWRDVMNRIYPNSRGYTIKAVVNLIYSVRVYRCDKFFPEDEEYSLLISITRKDGKPVRGSHWLDFQRIKREIGYGDYWACEWYPPDEKVLDSANVYYLYLWPKESPVPNRCCLEGNENDLNY